MAIPEFTEYGLLPPGIHDASQHEVVERYCTNPNRREIWDLFLLCYSTELSQKGWSNTILIDGGFTSDKPTTKDVDVVLDVSALQDHRLLEAYFWHADNHDRLLDQYKTDFWLYHPLIPNDLRIYFTYIKEHERLARGAPPTETKGLLRIQL
jgi:hypothetical protein